MMKKVYAGLLILAWGIQLLALSGCAVSGDSLSEQGLIAVQRVSSQQVDIVWADVYKADKDLMARGLVRRRDHSSQPLLVHVDAAVLSRDGEILGEATGRDVWVPRRSVGKGFNHSDFEIRLPVAPPGGGRIKLVCHAGSRDIHSQVDSTQTENRSPGETARKL